jgi:glycopeptide antibiotics resistance protein
MSSVPYQENTARKSMPSQLAKIAVLLLISLGLYQFTNNFPFYTIFEPQSAGWTLWVSYANDLIQPFAFYFFLCLAERWLKTWQVRALIALAIPVLLELGQLLYQLFYTRLQTAHYFGAFDPMDIVVYIIGVGLAVLIERKVFTKLFKNW